MMRRLRERFQTGLLVIVWIMLGAVTTPTDADICSSGNVPAATLLVPYFEVDVAEPSGLTTLFSVGNVTSDPVLTYVSLWTDFGLPILGFFMPLGPEGIQTINLRDVLATRAVPGFDGFGADDFPTCFQNPTSRLVGYSAASLRQQLTGQAEATTGRCFGRDRGEPDRAVGYVTVDLASDCEPLDGTAHWFGGFTRGTENILWGEVFSVDPGQNAAQGRNAVAIRYEEDFERYPDRFYAGTLGHLPTDEVWRSRFFSGDGVGAETEFVVWMNSKSNLFLFPNGARCGFTETLRDTALRFRIGPPGGPLEEDVREISMDGWVRKFELSELVAPESDAAGVIEFEAWHACRRCDPPDLSRTQSVVWPIYRADGRFSLTFEGTPMDGSCRTESGNERP